MGRFVKGDIVVVGFPFSDLSASKRRPALVISSLDGHEVILCQITSHAKTDKYAVRIESGDYTKGSLKVESVVRPNKIFTADESIIQYVACRISGAKTEQVTKILIDIVTSN